MLTERSDWCTACIPILDAKDPSLDRHFQMQNALESAGGVGLHDLVRKKLSHLETADEGGDRIRALRGNSTQIIPIARQAFADVVGLIGAFREVEE